MIAGTMAASGLDFLLVTGGRAPGIVTVAAGYIAGLGLLWIADEIAEIIASFGSPNMAINMGRSAVTPDIPMIPMPRGGERLRQPL